METFILTVYAKPGREDHVAQYYRMLGSDMKQARGFRSSRVFQATPGAMSEVARRLKPDTEHAADAQIRHNEPGTQFVIFEEWDTREDRVAFSQGVELARRRAHHKNLLPGHTHEFYTDVTLA